MQLALILVVCVALSIAKTLVHNPFVTIMDRDRTPCTHPDRVLLGKAYIVSIDQSLSGVSQVEEYVGTLAESVRAIVPITDSSGEVTAMVAVEVPSTRST